MELRLADVISHRPNTTKGDSHENATTVFRTDTFGLDFRIRGNAQSTIRVIFGLMIASILYLVPASQASVADGSLLVAIEADYPAGVSTARAAPAKLRPGCVTNTTGDGFARCILPTSKLIGLGPGPGTSFLNFTGGPVVTGASDGSAFAKSFGTSITEDFTNATAKPAKVTGEIFVFAMLHVAAVPGETSDAKFSFAIKGLPLDVGKTVDLPCDACGSKIYAPGPKEMDFSLTVPADSNVDIVIDPYVLASSNAGVPEPSSLLLFGPGILGLGGFLRKRLLT